MVLMPGRTSRSTTSGTPRNATNRLLHSLPYRNAYTRGGSLCCARGHPGLMQCRRHHRQPNAETKDPAHQSCCCWAKAGTPAPGWDQALEQQQQVATALPRQAEPQSPGHETDQIPRSPVASTSTSPIRVEPHPAATQAGNTISQAP